MEPAYVDLENPVQAGKKPVSLFTIFCFAGGVFGFILVAVLALIYAFRTPSSTQEEQISSIDTSQSDLYQELLTFQSDLDKFCPVGKDLLTPQLISDIEAKHIKLEKECGSSDD